MTGARVCNAQWGAKGGAVTAVNAGTANEQQLGRLISSQGGDVGLTADGRSSGRVILPRTTTYTVRVRGRDDYRDRGAYRFQVHPVERAPEDLAPAVVGDTVEGESVEPPGDVDEFTFQGTEGQEVAVFFQALSGSSMDDLELTLLADAGTANEEQLGRVTSDGGDPTLEGQSTGTITLPATAGYTVRVQGLASHQDRGPYRFEVRGTGGG